MVRFSLLQTAAMALAVVAGSLAVPALAQDGHERGNGRMEREAARDDNGQGWRGRGGQQQQAAPADNGARQARAAARQQERAPMPQATAPRQRSAPEGGWRSQRAAEGTRYGRDWSNDGAVSRPAPAYRGATPPTPDRQADAQRGWRGRDGSVEGRVEGRGGRRDGATATWRGERNRGYTDRDRNTTYRDGTRDGRTADTWRDRSQQRDSYRSGYRTGSRDGYRSGSHGDHRRWDNNWRHDRRYDWSSYRTHNRDAYRIGRYYSPYRNYRYSRLSIGFFLDSGFYGNRYWIDDPWQYRLPAVYGPYRWVRYYDDVLLVDIYTGEVVDVIHDFFW